MALIAAGQPHDYFDEGPFTCVACGGEILRGEPHQRNWVKRASTIAPEAPQGVETASVDSRPAHECRHFCCDPPACRDAFAHADQKWPACNGAHVTNVGWWLCSQCGIAHGGHCPAPDGPLPPWPPPGWTDPETGRSPVDRREEVARRATEFALRPGAVAGQRRQVIKGVKA